MYLLLRFYGTQQSQTTEWATICTLAPKRPLKKNHMVAINTAIYNCEPLT